MVLRDPIFLYSSPSKLHLPSFWTLVIILGLFNWKSSGSEAHTVDRHIDIMASANSKRCNHKCSSNKVQNVSTSLDWPAFVLSFLGILNLVLKL